MLKLSKKVEYGLIAIRHIASVNNHISNVKEISEKYSVPGDVLAKVMQKLTKGKLILSHQGAMGGYTLAKRADEISVMDVISVIEGTQVGIAQCFAEEPENCSIYSSCTIKNPLAKIQHSLEHVFNSMKVSEIV
ncbi:MAG: Rrf2 family transcriptional regulator [Bacteroidota bacterium]